jgi:hypothetical protein
MHALLGARERNPATPEKDPKPEDVFFSAVFLLPRLSV